MSQIQSLWQKYLRTPCSAVQEARREGLDGSKFRPEGEEVAVVVHLYLFLELSLAKILEGGWWCHHWSVFMIVYLLCMTIECAGFRTQVQTYHSLTC